MEKERVWNDPVADDPKQSADRLWRITFMGGINILMGIILFLVIKFSEVPIDLIPGLFLCVGGSFVVIGSYMSYREKRLL